MNRTLFPVLALLLALTGCQSTPTIGDRDASAPVGPDGLTVEDIRSLEEQRMEQVIRISEDLNRMRRDVEVKVLPHPLKRPTVNAKYSGEKPSGDILDNTGVEGYRASRKEDGDVLVYSTDLAEMTLIFEKQEDGEYEYREMTKVVPYGFCLDFIVENIGKTRKGYTLRKVECSQENIGAVY